MPLDLTFTCISADASATINVARSNMRVAPEGMVFTVTLEGFDTPGPATPDGYNPQHHEIYYFWDFGDPGSTHERTTNVLAHQRDANTMTGPVAAHTYATPGAYTVSVLVMEPASGKSAIATLDLSGAQAVRDPEVVFIGPNTYWMDVAGNGAGAPQGALVYSDIQAALDHAWQNAKPCRLLFRDGQTWDVAGLDIRGERAYTNILMTGQGSGARPVLRGPANGAILLARSWSVGNTMDIVAAGLTFEGPWDEVTEADPLGAQGSLAFSLLKSGDNAIIDYFWAYDCRFDGFYSSVNTSGDVAPSTALGIGDCIVESWLNIGAFLNTDCPTAVIGSRFARDPAALAGGEKPHHNVHGPIRSQHAGPMVIAKCDMFSNAGWFENVVGYRTQQPCIRIFQSGYAGGLANVAQNSFEGGYQVIALSRQDPARRLGTQNAVVDGNLLIGGHQTAAPIRVEFGGLTIRNNVGIRPDVPTIGSVFDPLAFVVATLPSGSDIGPATPQELADNAAAPIGVYNNTYAMLMSDGNFTGAALPAQIASASGFTAVSEANNVLHAPNAGTPLTADAPLDTTVLFAPRMAGYRSAYERIDHPLGGDLAAGASFTLPYPAGRGAGDYGPTTSIDPHEITTSAGRFDTNAGTAAFAFGASGITITNLSGQTWAAGQVIAVLYCLTSPPPTLTQYATPATTVATYAPQLGSAALGDAIQDPVAIADFLGGLRDVYPSRGAHEIAP